jgi:hypothetical protein
LHLRAPLFVLLQVDVEIGQNQLVLDEAPNDRVISSPSNSTTGFFILIFGIDVSSTAVLGPVNISAAR